MRAQDLVFWLDVLSDDPDRAPGALCQRHANSMVVPRGWTLDDLRDPDLHLFRPPESAPTPRPAVSRSTRVVPMGEQLRLGVDQTDEPAADEPAADEHAADEHAAVASIGLHVPAPWAPTFDEADDLDGLLTARSPLLSRAFRTAESNDR